MNIGFDYDGLGFDIGTNPILQRHALPDERRIQGSDVYTWSHGKNVTKAGVDINRVKDYIDNLYDENGSYDTDTAPQFYADYLHATTGAGGAGYGKQYYSFSQGFGLRQGEISTTDYAGFLSNDLRLTPRLTLTAGLRYEYQYIPPNPYPNTTGISGPYLGTTFTLTSPVPQTLDKPDDRNNIQPRVGFALDVYGTGKTFLRGGYGYYFGRIPNANILQVYLASGGPNSQIRVSSPGGTSCNPQLTFPNIFPSGIAGALQFAEQCGATGSGTAASPYVSGAQTSVAYLDPHLQNPQVQEIDFAIEQNLGNQTVISVSYLGSLGRELASAVDRNLQLSGTTNITYTAVNTQFSPNQGYQLPLPRGGVKAPPIAPGAQVTLRTYTGGSGTRTGANGQLSGVYQLLDFKSDVNSAYNALSVQISKRFTQNFGFLAHYTWAHALDYNPYLSTGDGTDQQLDPNDLHQEYGNSSLNVRNRFVFAGYYRTNFSSGNRLERALQNGWETSVIAQTQTGLPFSANTAKTALNATYSGIIGAGGINRLPKFDAFGNLLSERNSYTLPNIAVVDLRLSRSFYMDDRLGHLRLELLGEAFNILNHQNITSVNTNAYTVCPAPTATPNFVDPRLVVGSSNCPAGGVLLYNPYFGTNRNSNSNSVYTPRQLEGSIRLHF